MGERTTVPDAPCMAVIPCGEPLHCGGPEDFELHDPTHPHYHHPYTPAPPDVLREVVQSTAAEALSPWTGDDDEVRDSSADAVADSVLDAIPDGWAKVDGRWVRLDEVGWVSPLDDDGTFYPLSDEGEKWRRFYGGVPVYRLRGDEK